LLPIVPECYDYEVRGNTGFKGDAMKGTTFTASSELSLNKQPLMHQRRPSPLNLWYGLLAGLSPTLSGGVVPSYQEAIASCAPAN